MRVIKCFRCLGTSEAAKRAKSSGKPVVIVPGTKAANKEMPYVPAICIGILIFDGRNYNKVARSNNILPDPHELFTVESDASEFEGYFYSGSRSKNSGLEFGLIPIRDTPTFKGMKVSNVKTKLNVKYFPLIDVDCFVPVQVLEAGFHAFALNLNNVFIEVLI